MKTILVWVLITNSYYGGVNYSPPVATVEDCKRMSKIDTPNDGVSSQCTQINLVVTK